MPGIVVQTRLVSGILLKIQILKILGKMGKRDGKINRTVSWDLVLDLPFFRYSCISCHSEGREQGPPGPLRASRPHSRWRLRLPTWYSADWMRVGGLPGDTCASVGQLRGVCTWIVRRVGRMETAPKPGRDIPPKKDKLPTKKKRPRRYWEEETTPTAAAASPGPPPNKKRNRELRPQKPKNTHTPKKSRVSKKPQIVQKPRERRDAEPPRSLSGAQDPFPGPAPVSVEVTQKFRRIDKSKKLPHSKSKTRSRLEVAEAEEEEISVKAARSELLLAEEPGFLEGEDGEDTAKIRQADIVEAVDIASAAKHFDLNLRQFGPYRLNYSQTGRHLAFGGRRGHVAALDWVTKKLMCEINVMEAVRDIRFLHSEALLAVAQNRWLHIYDNQGIELHCIRRCDRVTRLEFLPFHFLLATSSETGFLTYLDVSVGKIVAALNARAGRLDVMTQNPYNAVIHLGHSNGAAEPNFDGLESNPYRSRKQRQEWEVKALLEKVPAELICLDPRALAEVDVISLEQAKKERIERLGYDPESKAPFQPKPKLKGRSSTASLVKRKRKVMDEEHRDKVRQSLEQQPQKQEKAAKPTGARPSALDRFVR
ncbi:WD repeat-containing protein 46 isoform X2 [Myotis myotis]|uniref:WD repeat-containing protein 46 isoform X2 n=1 Tax=Myotis myotis TaxID=51298 RepID=UPI00174879E4|nr:WD repeat-containing protein 46 isoform X2 [Myotis myotis]